MELKSINHEKTDQYYIDKIVTDLEFVIKHTSKVTKAKLNKDEVLLDSIMFRIIQIGENSSKISDDFKTEHPEVPWLRIKGMRNVIVHNYGNVDLSMVYHTIKVSIPEYLKVLKKHRSQE